MVLTENGLFPSTLSQRGGLWFLSKISRGLEQKKATERFQDTFLKFSFKRVPGKHIGTRWESTLCQGWPTIWDRDELGGGGDRWAAFLGHCVSLLPPAEPKEMQGL